MQIQWYPGHMYKAGKEIKKTLANIDLIIEIIDARLPFSSENPKLAELRGDKPCIKLLSKSDLADESITQRWQQYFEQQRDVKTLAISSFQPEKAQQIPNLCRKMLPHKRADKTINVLIMGIPNVGKSTLINLLAGRTIAKTGNEPAVTKMQQRIDLKNGVVLFDTPGMMWPNVENKNSGYRLATTGAIKDTALKHDDVAFFAAEYLLEAYPEAVMERYQLESLPKNEAELMDAIGKRRGCLRAGKQIDLDKTAKILLAELRAGTLGAISYETPEMIEVEMAELEIIREQKAAKKASGKKKSSRKRR
ncbi:MAG: ribosome biogenesis GTPase YlqF [Methylococcaceae bacterium]|nr:ribosome biogenesis GTPase YlqF [Methylococcaceae bacterium]